MSANRTAGNGSGRLAHDSLLFHSDEELAQFAVPFLTEALASDEAALVVAHPRTRDVLEDALTGRGPVTFIAAPEVFTRTTSAVLAYQELVEDAAARGAGRLRALSEVDFGDDPDGRRERLRFEAVTNVALAQHPLWNVCLYDARSTPPEVLDAGALAHPYLVAGQRRVPNPGYLAPTELLRRHRQCTPYALEAGPPTLSISDVSTAGLSQTRRRAHASAHAGSAMPPDRIDEFIEAVNELVTNALMHGSGPVAFRLWVAPHQLVVTVTDAGDGFDDPLAGFLPAPVDTMPQNGAGLWLARNFSDSLDFSNTPQGFTARVASWSRGDEGRAG